MKETASNIKGMLISSSLILFLGASSCVTDILPPANDLIEDAITAIGRPTADIENILSKLIADLAPNGLPNDLRTVLEYGAGITIAQTNAGIQCQPDILVRRVQRVLRYVDDRLQNKSAALPAPIVCGTTPTSIELNRGPSSWGEVVLFGYGMGDTDDGQQRYRYNLEQPGAAPTEIPVARISKYTATLNLSGKAIRRALFDAGSEGVLRMSWNGSPVRDQGEIFVIGWSPRQTPVVIPETTVGWRVPSCAAPSRCGDREFDNDDGPAEIIFEARPVMNASRDRIDLFVEKFEARELEEDQTMLREIERFESSPLYRAPPGWRLRSFTPEEGVKIRTRIAEDASRGTSDNPKTWTFSFPPGSAFLNLQVQLSRSGGRDAGEYTKYRYKLRRIRVIQVQTIPDWLDD